MVSDKGELLFSIIVKGVFRTWYCTGNARFQHDFHCDAIVFRCVVERFGLHRPARQCRR